MVRLRHVSPPMYLLLPKTQWDGVGQRSKRKGPGRESNAGLHHTCGYVIEPKGGSLPLAYQATLKYSGEFVRLTYLMYSQMDQIC